MGCLYVVVSLAHAMDGPKTTVYNSKAGGNCYEAALRTFKKN